MKYSKFLIFLMGFLCSPIESAVQLSFDSLFPESSQKQLHDTLLQLWSDLSLLHNEDISQVQKKDLADLVAGQLVRIGHLVGHIKTKNVPLYQDDIVHMRSIIGGLSHNFGDFFAQEHVKALWQQISDAFEAM